MPACFLPGPALRRQALPRTRPGRSTPHRCPRAKAAKTARASGQPPPSAAPSAAASPCPALPGRGECRPRGLPHGRCKRGGPPGLMGKNGRLRRPLLKVRYFFHIIAAVDAYWTTGANQMARRKRHAVAEDVFELAAALPWWAGVALALLAYAVLHHFAAAPAPASPGQIGQAITGQLVATLATIGQYLVPFLLLAGALASALGQRKRRGLAAKAAGSHDGAALRAMRWRDFELLVGQAFPCAATPSRKPAATALMAALTCGCARAAKPFWCSASSGEPSRCRSAWCASCTA